MGHLAVNCTRQIRCRNCYNYGHIAKNYLNRFSKSLQKWVPKQKQPASLAQIGRDRSGLLDIAISPPALESTYKQYEKSTLNPAPLQVPPTMPLREVPMANFEVNPMPWLSWGHHIIDGGGPTRLPRSFYYPAHDPPQ
jgi:hypothetical protein